MTKDQIYTELLKHFRSIELDFIAKLNDVRSSLSNSFKFSEDVRKDLEIKYINQKDDIIRLENRVKDLENQVLEIQVIKELLNSYMIKPKPVKNKLDKKPKL